MDTAKSFLRSIMDIALVIIPLAVVLGLIFGSDIPFIGNAVVNNITNLVELLGNNGLVGIIVLGILYWLARR